MGSDFTRASVGPTLGAVGPDTTPAKGEPGEEWCRVFRNGKSRMEWRYIAVEESASYLMCEHVVGRASDGIDSLGCF